MMTRSRGFSLIEIMVVILIIGMMVSGVSVIFGGKTNEETLRDEMFRFSATFQFASDYALLNNKELGLVVENNAYGFVEYKGEEGWLPFDDDPVLAIRELPETFELELVVEGLEGDEPSMLEQAIAESQLFARDEEAEEDDSTFGRKQTRSSNSRNSERDANREGEEGEEEEQEPRRKLFPQIFILPDGDINSFELNFVYTPEDFSDPVSAQLIGRDTVPLVWPEEETEE